MDGWLMVMKLFGEAGTGPPLKCCVVDRLPLELESLAVLYYTS